MIDYVNERFEFYKKMKNNQSMKNLICQMMFSNYQKHIESLPSPT